MLTKEIFEIEGPLLVDRIYGKEPSLKELLFRYYSLAFCKDEAEKYTEKYIEEFIQNLKGKK